MAGVLFLGLHSRRARVCASACTMNDTRAAIAIASGRRRRFREGAIATFPLMPGLFAFGLAFGTVAARQGFSLLDAVAMSAIVFSGVAQIIVVDPGRRS